MHVIEAENVSKRFGNRIAVDALNLRVPKGACYGLLGPNGAGKTTTLRMTYGVTRPDIGSIKVFGLDSVKHGRAVRSRIGVTLQDTVMIEALDVYDNLKVFGRYHLLSGVELDRRARDLMERLELDSHAGMPVKTLSGGFQRRLAVALSLMSKPELLILDEPTTGLDPAVRVTLWELVRELRREGTTVLLTTHYMDEAERLCDELAIFSQGRVIAEGAPKALIREHLAREAVEFEIDADDDAALLQGLSISGRPLRIGRRTTVYLNDAAPLLARLREADPEDLGNMVVRPTNLEDVFLTLTGTRLEGGA